MNKKSSLKDTALVLFFIIITANISVNVPSVYAVDWSPEMRITWNPEPDLAPSLAQATDGRIWFVWHSDRTGDNEIYYKIYNSAATNPWSSEFQLTDSLGFDVMPSIMHSTDHRTWVAWQSRRATKWGIYYKIYDGTSWTNDMNITNNLADDTSPSLMQTANGTIWLFWSSRRTGNNELYLKTYNGASWSDDRQITFTSALDEKDPYVTQSSDGKIWLVLERSLGIFYMTSFDGVSWSSTGTITPSSGSYWNLHPSIAQASDGKMWAVWDSDRVNDPYGQPQNDIFYRIYDGASWLSETRFTTDFGEDAAPSIMCASDGARALWVTWSATRAGKDDIYFKTTSLPLPHDVAVFHVEALKSMVALGHIVSIEVVAQNHGINTETFTINLYANTTLIGSRQIVNLIPGDLYPIIFDWNTSGHALGTYDIMAIATVVTGETHTADNTYVDGKVMVVIHDIAVLSVASVESIAYYLFYRNVSVDVRNEGTVSEDVTVAAYCNSTELGVQTVFLEPGVTVKLWFYIFDVPVGNYTMSAEAYPVLDEDHQADNYRKGGTVLVTIPGDVNGDKTVDILDVSGVSAHWYPGPPEGPLGYELSFDINEDEAVDVLEKAILSFHWGETW